jgi:hypothetical protein
LYSCRILKVLRSSIRIFMAFSEILIYHLPPLPKRAALQLRGVTRPSADVYSPGHTFAE